MFFVLICFQKQCNSEVNIYSTITNIIAKISRFISHAKAITSLQIFNLHECTLNKDFLCIIARCFVQGILNYCCRPHGNLLLSELCFYWFYLKEYCIYFSRSSIYFFIILINTKVFLNRVTANTVRVFHTFYLRIKQVI